MPTELLIVNPTRPEQAIIDRAATLLRAGCIVVFPTETVYGLGADSFQIHAVERIFAAKGRPFSDPLIVHIATEIDLQKLVRDISPQARELAKAFWPGPLTLILPRRSDVPAVVSAGLATVAVRMPRHPAALALIRAVGSPIAAPSANRFMHVSPTHAQHAMADLAGRVPLILDGGPCEVGIESTVLDLCAAVPTILRAGGISLEALRSVLPDVHYLPHRHTQDQDAAIHHNEEAIAYKSPGQLSLHYAPTVPLLLYDGSAEEMRTAMLAEVRRRHEQGEHVGVLTAVEDAPLFRESPACVYPLGSATNPEQLATNLFMALRALEETPIDVILCRSFDEHGLGLAVRDRLLRAAGGKVIET